MWDLEADWSRNNVLVCVCVCMYVRSSDQFSRNAMDSWSTLPGAQCP